MLPAMEIFPETSLYSNNFPGCLLKTMLPNGRNTFQVDIFSK